MLFNAKLVQDNFWPGFASLHELKVENYVGNTVKFYRKDGKKLNVGIQL
jgi:hypothetical protein